MRSDFPERDDERWLTHLTTTRAADGTLVLTEHRVDGPANDLAPAVPGT